MSISHIRRWLLCETLSHSYSIGRSGVFVIVTKMIVIIIVIFEMGCAGDSGLVMVLEMGISICCLSTS